MVHFREEAALLTTMACAICDQSFASIMLHKIAVARGILVYICMISFDVWDQILCCHI